MVTTADRADPVAYRPWAAPVVVTGDERYVGKHRHLVRRTFSLRRMLYTARHCARWR